jgi:glycosyltransferase involved in cell wall biosynthesis
MASGRPVVTTAIGGMRDMVEDGESGLLVSPGDSAGLASALKNVLADSGLRARLGANGKERVLRFTASAVAGQLEQVYAKAASPVQPVADAATSEELAGGSQSHLLGAKS